MNQNDEKNNSTGFSFGAVCGSDRRRIEQRNGGAGSPGTTLAEKQEIVRHIKDEPASLDPIKAVGLPEAQLARDLFEGLVNQDANGKVIPGVATRWQTTDNQTYIFTLRKDARWSNGDPVTAKDFVYSWQRLVEPKVCLPLPGLLNWQVSRMPMRSLPVNCQRTSWA